MDKPRVMVVDDNLVVRSGLISLLEAADVQVVAEACDGQQAIEEAERVRPDVVLLDVRMPLVDGVAAAKLLSRISQVIMLTYTDDPDIIRSAIANGAVGYLVHESFTADELAAAVHGAVRGGNPLSPAAVSALVGAVRQDHAPEPVPVAVDHAPALPPQPEPPVGKFGLSAREIEVMQLIVRGHSNGEIAGHLFLAEKTVKNHVNRIYAKLGVTSRAAAIARWIGTADGGAL
jgi:DNA-binding NarL/FixJ family response regulator